MGRPDDWGVAAALMESVRRLKFEAPTDWGQ